MGQSRIYIHVQCRAYSMCKIKIAAMLTNLGHRCFFFSLHHFTFPYGNIDLLATRSGNIEATSWQNIAAKLTILKFNIVYKYCAINTDMMNKS